MVHNYIKPTGFQLFAFALFKVDFHFGSLNKQSYLEIVWSPMQEI